MNEYDSNRIYDLVKKINYKKTENLEDADCYVLNTCHIREKATDKVYHDVGRIKKQFKNRKKPIVVITGCVAQAEGEILLKDEKYIDAVIGPQSFQNFNKILIKIENEKKRINFTNFEVIEKFDTLNSIKTSSSKISSFLTIQEGCDKFCKFCVVPYTRGAEFSRTIDEIVNECNELVSNGAKEISLLGQNVNAYKHKGKNLSDLINEISKIKNLLRIRYTTSHPIDFSNDLIKMHETKEKLMPLIHLPVQSGSNKILNLMNRKHSVEQYLNLISRLKQINPLIKFSSDFIIGYPGETDIDFEDTLKLLKEVNFINTYSFIYSPRPGTPAAKMNKTDMSISRQRLERFQKIADEIKLKYRLNLVKQKSSVLFENRVGSKNEFFGRDEFSNSVIVKSDEDINGKIKDVIIKSVNRNTLFGEINQKIDRSNFAA
tara:strand:- start:1556 stop:2851 length:1296 start_codon:yes stop_codon:yes gene_type:complete